MPKNLITGLFLEHTILAIARAVVQREKELGESLLAHEVTYLVQEAQNRYKLLADGNPVNVTSLAGDVINGMQFLKNLKTKSVSSEGYHLLKSEFAAGGSALRDVIPDLRREPLRIPELETVAS
ncbi:hypothetical protein [Acidovorax sp.]|uniref:hypothetical protein n=1 Tax=Acidovorax sp. TaxID=1872122 RepID=UPI00391F934A